MKIKVVDSLMGTGKTQAAFQYINAHPEKQFIYTAPYQSEVTRARKNCPSMKMCRSGTIWEMGKGADGTWLELVENSCDVATTHNSLGLLSPEVVETIYNKGYTLIIDEPMMPLYLTDINKMDYTLLHMSRAINKSCNHVITARHNCDGTHLEYPMKIIEKRNLYSLFITHPQNGSIYYLAYPKDVLEAFDEVIILCYMFEWQEIKWWLDTLGAEYEKFGLKEPVNGKYEFCPYPGYFPEYVQRLDKLFTFPTRKGMNAVQGESARIYNLTISWFGRSEENVKFVKDNLRYFFKKLVTNKKPDNIMWGSYPQYKEDLTGNGYTKCFVPYNQRCTNKWRKATNVAYCANPMIATSLYMMYFAAGIKVNRSQYNLNTTVQWVWRSSIANGHPVHMYMPATKTREAFKNWITMVMEQANSGKKIIVKDDLPKINVPFNNEEQTISKDEYDAEFESCKNDQEDDSSFGDREGGDMVEETEDTED